MPLTGRGDGLVWKIDDCSCFSLAVRVLEGGSAPAGRRRSRALASGAAVYSGSRIAAASHRGGVGWSDYQTMAAAYNGGYPQCQQLNLWKSDKYDFIQRLSGHMSGSHSGHGL